MTRSFYTGQAGVHGIVALVSVSLPFRRYARWYKSPKHTIVAADEEKKVLAWVRSG